MTQSARSRVLVCVIGVMVALTGALAPAAAAAPSTPRQSAPQSVPQDDDPDLSASNEPSAPMPVPSGAYAYLATRTATVWLAQQNVDELVANMPVPPQYRNANYAMALQLRRELDTAVAHRGACVQIIVDPSTGAGNLFDYGVWAVDAQYCP